MLDLTKLEGKTIKLAQRHIDAGIRGAVRHHPIALALNDVVDKDVLAEIVLRDGSLVFCTVIDNANLTELYPTTELEQWAWAFERGEKVVPATLTVFQPDDEHDETQQLWISLEEIPHTPLTYHVTADSITAFVNFADGEQQVWEAHGTPAGLELVDNNGLRHYTIESLKTRNVRCFVLENRHEVEVD